MLVDRFIPIKAPLKEKHTVKKVCCKSKELIEAHKDEHSYCTQIHQTNGFHPCDVANWINYISIKGDKNNHCSTYVQHSTITAFQQTVSIRG